jgi:hypothetical protein
VFVRICTIKQYSTQRGVFYICQYDMHCGSLFVQYQLFVGKCIPIFSGGEGRANFPRFRGPLEIFCWAKSFFGVKYFLAKARYLGFLDKVPRSCRRGEGRLLLS